MKLHLPKGLRTALLACILAASPAYAETLTLSPANDLQFNDGTHTIKESNNNVTFTFADGTQTATSWYLDVRFEQVAGTGATYTEGTNSAVGLVAFIDGTGADKTFSIYQGNTTTGSSIPVAAGHTYRLAFDSVNKTAYIIDLTSPSMDRTSATVSDTLSNTSLTSGVNGSRIWTNSANGPANYVSLISAGKVGVGATTWITDDFLAAVTNAPIVRFDKPIFTGPEYTYSTAQGSFLNADGKASNPARGDNNTKGPVLIFDNVGTVTGNAGVDTSDYGGVKVTRNSIVTCHIGSWAGSIYVGEDAILNASYSAALKSWGSNSGSPINANVYVEGTLNLSRMSLNDGQRYHNWYIGAKGTINLGGDTFDLGGRQFYLEVVTDYGSAENTALVNRDYTSKEVNRTIMTMTGDGNVFSTISSNCVIYDLEGKQLTASDVTLTKSDDSTAILLNYTWKGYEAMDLYANSDVQWTKDGTADNTLFDDAEANGEKTSYRDGDSVTINAGTVTAQTDVTAATLTLNGGSLNLNGKMVGAKTLVLGAAATIDASTGSLNADYLRAEGNDASLALTGSLSLDTPLEIAGDMFTFKSGNLTLTGTGTPVVQGGKLVVEGGELTLVGGANAFAGSELLVSGGTLEINCGTLSSQSCIKAGSEVKVTGGTLKLTGHDMLGWGNVSPSAINLNGSEITPAKLIINDKLGGNDNFMTLSSQLVLQGFTSVEAATDAHCGICVYGTTVTASGTNNEISLDLKIREANSGDRPAWIPSEDWGKARSFATFDVAAGGELSISGRLLDATGEWINKADVKKIGDGTLIIKSDSSDSYTGKWNIEEGTLRLETGAKVGTGIVNLTSGAKLESNGSVELANTVTGSGSLSILAGGNLTVTGNVTLGASIENAGTFDLASGGELRFTSRDILEKNTNVVYKDKSVPGVAGNGYSSGSYFIVKAIGDNASTTGISSVYLVNEGTEWSVDAGVDGTITIDENQAAVLGGLYYITLGGGHVKETVTGDDGTTTTTTTFVDGEFVYETGSQNNLAASDNTTGLVLDTASGLPYLTLVLKNNLNENATDGIIVLSDATIKLDGSEIRLNKATILQKQIEAADDSIVTVTPTLKLTGKGTYVMDNAMGLEAGATQVVNPTATTDTTPGDPGWTGTVEVTNTKLGGKNDGRFSITELNHLASSDTTGQTSTIKISGLSGYAYDATNGTSPKVTADLVLVDIPAADENTPAVAALTLTDAPENAGLAAGTLALNGKLSGTGSIVNNSKGNVSLGGDIEDWTGSYTASSKDTQLVFTEAGSVLNASVEGGSLKVGSGAGLTIQSEVTLDKTIQNSGTLELGGGGKVSFKSLAELDHQGEISYKDDNSTAGLNNGYASGIYYVIQGYTGSDFTLEKVFVGAGDNALEYQVRVDTDATTGVKSGVIYDMDRPGDYYITEGTVNYGANDNSAADADTTGIVLMGGTLNMQTGLKAEAKKNGIRVKKSSTIRLDVGGKLDDVALEVSDGIKLTLESAGTALVLDKLDGDGKISSVEDVLVDNGGTFTGTYEGVNPVRVGTSDKDAHQVLRASANLMVIGNEGKVDLIYTNAEGYTLGGIDTTGATVLLNNKTNDDKAAKVSLKKDSSMKDGGVLDFTVSATEVNAALKTDGKPTVTTGASLSLKDVTLKVHEVENTGLDFNAGGKEKDILLFVLNDKAGCSVSNVTVDMSDCTWMTKYFTNFRAVEGSVDIIADANTGYYVSHGGQTPNGTAGLALAGKAMFHLNPRATAPNGELAQVLTMLDNQIDTGNTGAMDKLGAALAGSSLSAVGLAVADDVQRQLRSIRNRTTTMGVNQCEVNEDMPYVNGWISGDGNYRQLSESGTDAGYQVSSWGGTVGVDVDVNPNLTLGVAVSALFGDYTGKAEDTLTGNLDTQYVSLFARVSTGSWVNTFVGTLGRADVDLERTIPGVAGKTTYKTNGMMFGFLYEVARTFALNDEATTCVQPLFNMSFSHTTLDSATEGGTADTRLTTDSASLTQFSLGLGGRLQSIVGENEYNRASIFEARALLKLDFGDRYSKLNTALAALPTATVSTRSNEKGVIGAEVGATLTIPISQDAGSIFFDVNADFNADEIGVNGSVGYRVNF
ncbi:MAG: autotransporter domain-containing protein [Akkermansia sp.]|nr:autotransporter domain-containing protein [Akkermansia sp.]